MRLLDYGTQGMSGREKKRQSGSIPKAVIDQLVTKSVLAEYNGRSYIGILNGPTRPNPDDVAGAEFGTVTVQFRKIGRNWIAVDEPFATTLEIVRVVN